VIGSLLRLLGRRGDAGAAAGPAAPPRERGEQSDQSIERRIDAARRRLKAAIPAPED
jgi:hypothetical protein